MTSGFTTEVFPIVMEKLPRLQAFTVSSASAAPNVAGGKLAYRLRKPLGGHWVWTNARIVTDSHVTDEQVSAVLRELWRLQPETFGDLREVKPDRFWRASPRACADFVAMGLAQDCWRDLENQLPSHVDLGTIVAERAFELHGWEVANRPAVSISVHSRLVHKQSLKEYLASQPRVEDLLGLEVFDRTGSYKGEVQTIVGALKDHRVRLLGLSQRPEMQELLKAAADDEPVLHIGNGRPGYDYAVSSLGLIVRVRDFPRFGVDSRSALASLKIRPDHRWGMVSRLAQVLARRGLIGPAFTDS